jgi:ribulose-5-phosphate 4-epimerase/fuculose-1-phosphate aldolase
MVLATTGRELGMYNDMAALFLDEQVVFVEDTNYPPVTGDRMSEAVKGGEHVLIAKNHGIIFLGDSLETTTVEAFTFEHASRIQVDAEQIGGTPHERAYVERSKKAYHTYYRPQMWAAAVRRLRRDTPEFFAGREHLVAVS